MRYKRKDYPLRVELLQAALELYAENGFTLTTNQMVANKVGCSTGQLTNFFGSKENILCEIMEKVLPVHQGTLVGNMPSGATPAVNYCFEIAMQIAMCERIETIRDIYINAYTMPKTFAMIREYSYKKSVEFFKNHLPEWSEQDFFETEALTMGIVYGGLMERCNPRYLLSKKIERVLDALLKLYEYPEDESKRTIETVLANDIEELVIGAHEHMRKLIEENLKQNDSNKKE